MKKRKITGNPLKEFYDNSTKEVNSSGITPENFEKKLIYALNNYHTIYDLKDCRKFLLDFFKYEKKVHEKIKMIDDISIHSFETFALNVKFLMESNVPVDIAEGKKEYFNKKIEELLAYEKKRIEPEKAEERSLNIQKSISEKAFQFSPRIDEVIDEFIFNKKKVDFDIVEYLKDSGLSNLHANKLYAYYEKQKIEYEDITTDQELREVNKHLSDKRIKDIIKFYDEILSNIENFNKLVCQRKNQNRKPKKQSVEKVISSIKYMKESQEYKVCSVNPSKIIGAKVCILFNERYKKLTILKSNSGFTLKGTTIYGFDSATSKILRNPNIFVKKYNECKKSEIDHLWNSIKSKEAEGIGRLSDVVLILNVFK